MRIRTRGKRRGKNGVHQKTQKKEMKNLKSVTSQFVAWIGGASTNKGIDVVVGEKYLYAMWVLYGYIFDQLYKCILYEIMC